MENKNDITGIIAKIVENTSKNEKMISFKNYRDHLKNAGILREDTYDWPNNKKPEKDKIELFGRHSKNAIINS